MHDHNISHFLQVWASIISKLPESYKDYFVKVESRKDSYTAKQNTFQL